MCVAHVGDRGFDDREGRAWVRPTGARDEPRRSRPAQAIASRSQSGGLRGHRVTNVTCQFASSRTRRRVRQHDTSQVLITGASSGIGEAFAEVFAAQGFDLVITARREDRLRAVAARLRAAVPHPGAASIVADHVACATAPVRLCAEIAARGLTIDALVNNAGYGVPGIYVASPWERHDAMLQVMVTGLVELTHRLLPGMIERGYGRIINVGIAGRARARARRAHALRRAQRRSSSSSRRRCRTRSGNTASTSRRSVPGFTAERVPRRDRHP